MQPNIVFLDEYSLGDADLGSIRALGNYTGYRTTAREEVADRCREADVVITNKVVFRRETLRQLPRLRLICVAATGMNHIDLEAAAELGIAVKNAVGYSTHAVTETTIGAAIGIIGKTKCDGIQNQMRLFGGRVSPKRKATKISHTHTKKHRSNGF